MPITFVTLLCASLAISGVPYFSAYFSKDAILSAAYSHSLWMFWVGAITAGVTSFYVFRAFFLAFFGTYRGHEHAHESSWVMTAPLIVLAVLSVGGGYIPVMSWLSLGFGPAAHENTIAMDISAACGILGILIAWLFYIVRPSLVPAFTRAIGPVYTLVFNKYYIDELNHNAIVRPLKAVSDVVLWRGVDEALIDGAGVNGMGRLIRSWGGLLRWFQSGSIRNYGTWVLVGALLAIFVFGLVGGVR
ncbi:MAG: proton-conducting transporter membrane subunit, partial [Bryobacteraceae bacterium]